MIAHCRVRTDSNVDAMFICSAEGCHRGYFTESSFREHQKMRHHINPLFEQQRQRIAARKQQQQQQQQRLQAAGVAAVPVLPAPLRQF